MKYRELEKVDYKKLFQEGENEQEVLQIFRELISPVEEPLPEEKRGLRNILLFCKELLNDMEENESVVLYKKLCDAGLKIYHA